MARNPNFSASINAARFAVSLLVVLAHVAGPVLAASGAPAWPLWFLNSRSLSSTFFFLLSGFILTTSLSSREGSPRPAAFLWQRVARLWPIHAAGFAAMLPTAFLGHQQFTLPQILAHAAAWLSMLHGFLPAVSLLYNTPAWAVTSFALGYLAVAWILRARHWPIRRILLTMLCLWLAVLAGQSAGMSLHWQEWRYQLIQTRLMTSGASWMQIFLHTSPLFRVPEIAIGSFAGILAGRVEFRRLWERRSLDTPAACTGGLLALLMVWVGAQDDRFLYLATHGALMPLCLLSLYLLWRSDSWLERLCQHPLLLQGGRSAMLIYFAHLPVFRSVQWTWSQLTGAGQSQAEASPFTLAIGFLLLFLLTFSLEKAYSRLCDALHSQLSPVLRVRTAACAQ